MAPEEDKLKAEGGTEEGKKNAADKKQAKKKRRRNKKKKIVFQDTPKEQEAEDDNVEIEYVSADIPDLDDPAFAAFKEVFGAFSKPEELTTAQSEKRERETAPAIQKEEKKEEEPEEEGDDDDSEEDEETKMSNKQKKKVNRLTIAELKNLVAHPDMVEMWDVTAADPRLLLFLKAYRNTVPVPRHWNQKRKYLQAKRGQEKPSYDLPDYIAQTGIADVRQTFVDDEKSSKQKQRERVRPKMGKMDLEYQVLFDAFFKHQTKPRLSNFGDQYYEGRELEIHMKEKKPGHLSDELKVALGMVEGGPTPWLINMQRYGPPPSYPNLRIGGLNAPIPKGAQWGYQPGGWGKPPIDEQGNPLYGDVFGINEEKEDEDEPPIDRTRWGELGESESEEEDEEEDEGEEEDEQGGVDESGMSSVTTYDSGMETPDAPSTINLRKMSGMETPETPLPPPSANTGEQPQLFTVLEEKKTKVGASLMGGSHVYVMNKDKKAGDVDVALQPGELEELQEGGEEFLQQKLEEKMAEEARANAGEDYSDIMAEESLKRKRKEDKKKEMKKLKKF